MSITAGTLSSVLINSTSASLVASPATGGTGPYTYQWYRSTMSGFTPGLTNAVIGATSLTLNDTDLSPDTAYYYVVIATDTGASNVTATYAQLTVMTLSTLRIGYMGALGAQLAQARQAGYDFITVTNLADLMNQMAVAASHGQRKFTVTYPVTYQPADLRGNTSCFPPRRPFNGSGCGCGANNCSGGCSNGSIYALPIGNSLGNNGYIGNGAGQGYGPLWPAFQSGVYGALFYQDIMENEVTVTLNLSDLITTSVNLNFTF